MIHGLGSSQSFFLPILPSLKDVRCIIPDPPRAGRSPFAGGKLSIQDIAGITYDLLEKLQTNKAIIVGHSGSGTVASDSAASHPSKTTAVVAIGPVGPNNDAVGIFEKRMEIVSKGQF